MILMHEVVKDDWLVSVSCMEDETFPEKVPDFDVAPL